jgi:hypothetical protein
VAILVALLLILTSPPRSWWYDGLLPWVEPLATVGAFAAAVGAAIFGALIFQRERQRDLDLEELRRQGQASLIVSWLQIGDVHNAGVLEYDHVLFVRNASQLPVFDVLIMGTQADGSRIQVWEVDVLGPDTLVTPQLGTYSSRLWLSMTFRDAANVYWKRDSWNVLTAVTPAQ